MPSTMLTLDQAKAELAANPGKYTTNQSLLDLAARLPVDPVSTLPAGSPPPLTLTYSGSSGIDGLSTQKIADYIGKNSGGNVRVIDQSPVADFLKSKDFQNAAIGAAEFENPSLTGGAIEAAANNFLYDATKGPWAETSARFMAAAPGDVLSLTSLASSDRTFAQIEIKGFLDNPNSQNFNGIPRDVIQTAYDLAATRGGAQAGIAAATDLAAVTSGVNVASEISVSTTLDVNGKPVLSGVSVGHLLDGREGVSGLSLPPEAVGESVHLSDSFFRPSAENTAAFERGGLALTEATTALKIVNVGGQIAVGLGNALVLVSYVDAVKEALAAAEAGNSEKASQIMTDWTLKTEGALVAGTATALAAAELLSPLLASGPVGGAAYLVGTLAAGALGAVAGDAAVNTMLKAWHGDNAEQPNVDINGNVISGGTTTSVSDNANDSTQTSAGSGYMGTDGVYRVFISGTSTSGGTGTNASSATATGTSRLELDGVIAPTTVQNNITKAAQEVLGDNASAAMPIYDEKGNITGYKVSSTTTFDTTAGPIGERTVILFDKEGNYVGGERLSLLGNGKTESKELDFETEDKLIRAIKTSSAEPDTEIPFTPIVATKDLPPDQVLTLAAADADDGVVSDAGSGSYVAGVNTATDAPNTIANSVIPATPVAAPTLNDLQNTTLNDALAAAGLNLDGNNPITALPPVNGMVILANADGDIVGTVDVSNAGSGGTANIQINGQPPQVVDRLGNSFDVDTAATLGTATGVLGLGNTLLGLANWDNASDLSHVQTVVSIYNQINGLANLGMPNMGGVGSVLSFYAACQNGDALGIAHSGLQMVDTITQLSTGTGMISSAFPDLIPGLGMVMALTNIEDNPLGVVCAALNFFPPAGPFIGAFLNIIQTVFTPAPVSEGEAHATFDEFGHLNIITDSEKHGGGSTSSYWMDRLAQGAQLNGIQTPQAVAYVMGMPTIGYKYNPDGFNYENANGHLTLRWIGADGQSYTRTYDANGSRDGDPADASNQDGITDIERDFQKLMHSSAKQYPPLAYEQLDGGVLQLDYGVATVVYAVNTHKFDGMAEHTHGGDEDTDAALDPAIEIGEGDKRLLQDDSNTIANSSKQTHVKVAASNLHTVVNPVIAPIQTKADLIGAGSNKVVSNGAITRPLGFVPLGGTDSLSQEKKNATAAMIKSAGNGLFGANSIASTAMAAAAVIQWPSLASAGVPNATNPLPAAERRYGVSDLRPWDEDNGSGADNNGSANKVQEIVRPTLTSNPAGKGTVQQDINAIDASTVQLGNIIGDAPASTANGYLIPASIAASSLSGEGAEAFIATGKASDLILTYPKVTGELVAGTEDTGLRFSSEMLLANDSTDNGRAYSNMPSLRISAVGSPTHGQVALRDVNYYEFNSSLGNKYAGYSLKEFSKSAILMQHSLNDDNLRIAA